MTTTDDAIADPATKDPSLSSQVGGTVLCPGPVMFPMASGAEADRWTQEFGYPLESQTGGISLGGMIDEVRESDEAGRFMLEVYDQIVAQKGGEGSETAAAFLSNFMPPMPQSGDQRRHYFKLVFADEVRHRTTSMSAMGIPMASSRIEAYRSGQLIDSADPALNLLGSEIMVFSGPEVTSSQTAGFYHNTDTQRLTPTEAARSIISQVETANQMKPWLDWLIFGATVLTVFAGVGVTVGAIRVAATTGARLMATTALVFETSEGTEYITGFIGGRAQGYNPLKSAFKIIGGSANGASGAQTAEYIYNTLNIGVGFGGKIGLFAGSLYAATQMPTACQPTEGHLDEQRLPSQGSAQRTVF